MPITVSNYFKPGPKKENKSIFQLGLIDSPFAMGMVKTKNVYWGGEENTHPTRARLHHVMREIRNDHAGDPFVHLLSVK